MASGHLQTFPCEECCLNQLFAELYSPGPTGGSSGMVDRYLSRLLLSFDIKKYAENDLKEHCETSDMDVTLDKLKEALGLQTMMKYASQAHSARYH